LAVHNAGTGILRNELPADAVESKGKTAHSGFVSSKAGPVPGLGFVPLKTVKGEPLRLELEAFFASVRDRSKPKVDGFGATAALRVAEQILDKIKEHSDVVARTLRQRSG
jgi:hypothetical protein